MNIKTVGDLITALKKYDKKLYVNTWDGDDSHWILGIDDSISGRIEIDVSETSTEAL